MSALLNRDDSEIKLVPAAQREVWEPHPLIAADQRRRMELVERGQRAFRNGNLLTDCPWDGRTFEGRWWRAGWRSASTRARS